ncbi:hypothetical protein [Streptomyces olivochromogenes]|uniref:hypothetical protein n=1 Tax=Streptomyces olivochromogenes TaxID=1963 RepID=UPI003690F7FC
MADHSRWLPKLVDDGAAEALGHVHQAVDLLPPGVTEHGLDDVVAAVLRANRPEYAQGRERPARRALAGDCRQGREAGDPGRVSKVDLDAK